MRWLKWALVGILVLGLGIAAFGTYLVRRSFPTVDGELTLSGLEDSVEVIRDDWGVAHIYASNPHDLFFAQGYTHAQERFWQMDVWRHIGSARVSEMFGESQVGADKFLRSLGLVDLAKTEYRTMSQEARDVLDWYADGVNAYLDTHDGAAMSLEYAILPLQNSGYEIEPWEPIHTLTWAKLMSYDLSGNMSDEISRTVLAKTLEIEQVEELFPDFPADHPVIVPDDQVSTVGSTRQAALVPDEAMPALASAGRNAAAVWALTGGGFEGIGSNNWVVGGSLTESGLPILANDTHLGIQMPSIWFSNGLHCESPSCPYELVGFSFPGTPGVVIGHNDRIAWGVTTQAVDTQDLFIEKVNPDNPMQYEVDGQWVDFDVRTETIAVAGEEPVSFDVLSTRHGPVISDTFLDPDLFDGSGAVDLPARYVVTLAWQTLQPSTLIEAILELDQAQHYDDFKQAMSKWDIAAQNVIYADVEGNIAYQSTGEVPIRALGDGRYPVPGWTSEYEWTGLVPYEEMPFLFNPPRDYIETANQYVLRPGSQPFLSGDSNTGYRGARIETIINEHIGPHTVASMQTLQFDSRDGGAENLVPHLLAVPSANNEAVEESQSWLKRWSDGQEAFQARGDSTGAVIYQGIWRHLLMNIFHDQLPEEEWPTGGDRWFEVVRGLLDEPESEWWDDTTTTGVETRDDVLRQSMIDAHAELTELLGSRADRWTWGRVHTASFENQTLGQSGIAPIEWLFNRDAPDRVGGGESIVNAVGWDPSVSYEVNWLPSERMVVDLSDFSSSTFAHTTGQSGHAFHRYYDNMIEAWTDGEQGPMYWDRATIETVASSTLTLLPAGS